MSAQARVRVVHVHGGTKEEVLSQIREQVGEDLPTELLEALVEKAGYTDKTSAKKSPLDIKAPFDFDERAEQIANLPPSERAKAVADSLDEITKAVFGEVTGKSRERVEKIAEAVLDEAGKKATDETFGNFEKARNTLVEAIGRDKVCSIGNFYQKQDALVDSLEYLAHEAGDHGSLAAAKLYLHIENYCIATNRLIYDTCNQHNVDPTHLGFSAEDDYAERVNDEQLIELRNKFVGMISAS